jgi:hypothetical protein
MKLSKLSDVEAHGEAVWSCTWIPPAGAGPSGAGAILTGSVDETVKRWDLNEAGALTESYKQEGQVRSPRRGRIPQPRHPLRPFPPSRHALAGPYYADVCTACPCGPAGPGRGVGGLPWLRQVRGLLRA